MWHSTRLNKKCTLNKASVLFLNGWTSLSWSISHGQMPSGCPLNMPVYNLQWGGAGYFYTNCVIVTTKIAWPKAAPWTIVLRFIQMLFLSCVSNQWFSIIHPSITHPLIFIDIMIGEGPEVTHAAASSPVWWIEDDEIGWWTEDDEIGRGFKTMKKKSVGSVWKNVLKDDRKKNRREFSYIGWSPLPNIICVLA